MHSAHQTHKNYIFFPEDIALLCVGVALEDLGRHPSGAPFHVGHHGGLGE